MLRYARLIGKKVERDGLVMMEIQDHVPIGKRYIVDPMPKPSRYYNIEWKTYWLCIMVQDIFDGCFLPIELLDITEEEPTLEAITSYLEKSPN